MFQVTPIDISTTYEGRSINNPKEFRLEWCFTVGRHRYRYTNEDCLLDDVTFAPSIFHLVDFYVVVEFEQITFIMHFQLNSDCFSQADMADLRYWLSIAETSDPVRV
jgi:hypothetical protein